MSAVNVKWNGKRRFVGWDEWGHGVVMDAGEASGGDNSGARPLGLVLYAIAGCSGMDVVSILEKKRQVVTDFEIVVTGTQREDGYPHIYERVELEYVVTGVGVKPEAVERAIELSHEKYCSVRGMLGGQVEVVTSYRVVEAER